MPEQPEKARITFLDGRQADQFIEVHFNPTEYTHEISNNYQEVSLPGLANPILQFVNGETQTLTMELLLDDWTDSKEVGVVALTEKLRSALAIDADLHAPPPVEFRWGSFTFKAVIQSLSQRFTMFNNGGIPVRARLNVTFKLYRPLSEQPEVTRQQSANKTKQRVMTSDDSLWMMAHREYGHTREWRRIARRNRIENPRLVPARTTLVLPPVEDRHGPAVL